MGMDSEKARVRPPLEGRAMRKSYRSGVHISRSISDEARFERVYDRVAGKSRERWGPPWMPFASSDVTSSTTSAGSSTRPLRRRLATPLRRWFALAWQAALADIAALVFQRMVARDRARRITVVATGDQEVG